MHTALNLKLVHFPTLLFLAITLTGATPPATAAETPQQLFERRIMPIFKSPNPSSCTECHLAGVDLKNYILPSHEQTFLSLRDQGLVDLKSPRDSKILRLISMQPEKNAGAALISEKVRRAELDAFTEWLVASAKDAKLVSAPPLNAASLARPSAPNEVIRHARKDNVLASFEDNVWAQRFRCIGCHLPGSAENTKLVDKHGEQVNWMQPQGAEATMNYLITNELVSVTAPERSKLLLKPLNEVKHGGGQKMVAGDLGYKAFRAWLEDYANVVNARYAKSADLPKLASSFAAFPTEIWLKLENTPPEWADKLLQTSVYAWDAGAAKWEADPIAVSDRLVFGKGKLWQHTLLLLAPKNSARDREWKQSRAQLPKGRYLVKVHVDYENALARDWRAVLGDAQFAGVAEIESAWPAGYDRMTLVNAARVGKK